MSSPLSLARMMLRLRTVIADMTITSGRVKAVIFSLTVVDTANVSWSDGNLGVRNI